MMNGFNYRYLFYEGEPGKLRRKLALYRLARKRGQLTAYMHHGMISLAVYLAKKIEVDVIKIMKIADLDAEEIEEAAEDARV